MSRILIIDDEPSWQGILSKEIVAKGTTIDLADSLADARTKLDNVRYDLAIVDLKLYEPQKKPLEAFGQLTFALDWGQHQKNAWLPLIIVTGKYILEAQELIKAINDYPGRIWGWHYKGKTFDKGEFRKSVVSAQQARYRKPSLSKWWRIVLTVVGLFTTVAGVALIFSTKIPCDQVSLEAITATTIALGLLVIVLANPETLDKILPFFRGFFGRE